MMESTMTAVAPVGPGQGGRGPLVSITVPVYNGARFLRERLDSIVGQTYPNVEILVMDDASIDATPEIIDLAWTFVDVGRFEPRSLAPSTARLAGVSHQMTDLACSQNVLGWYTVTSLQAGFGRAIDRYPGVLDIREVSARLGPPLVER